MQNTLNKTKDQNRLLDLRRSADEAAQGLPALLLQAEHLANTISLGVHGRRKAGMGESFWQFRRYRAEDPASSIDWRQSAKSQHLFVREREWESAETMWFWCDHGPGMVYGSSSITKLERARLLSLALASLLLRGGERIGLLGEGLAPMTGRAALSLFGQHLVHTPPAMPDVTPLGRKGALILFSDFLMPVAALEAALQLAANQTRQVHLVHIMDPAEADFPFSGRIRFETPDGALSTIIGRADAMAAEYRQAFADHCAALKEMARRSGWLYLAHRSDQRPEAGLLALYSALSSERALRERR